MGGGVLNFKLELGLSLAIIPKFHFSQAARFSFDSGNLPAYANLCKLIKKMLFALFCEL